MGPLIPRLVPWTWPLLLCCVFAALPATRAADTPLDDYVVAAQSECFTSKRIVSCFRYKAARYLWSAASGRMNFFDKDSSRRMTADSGADADPVRSSFQFVQLSEPSTALVFPGARQEMGDSAAVQVWKFLKRSWATFLSAHGIRFGLDSQSGGRIFDADSTGEHLTINEARLKKKKWQVIVPLAILGKLMHLKIMLLQILLGLGAIQTTLIAGGALLYYYLKYNTICRFEPHVLHTHSHVTDAMPEISHSAYATYPAWGGGGGGGGGGSVGDSMVSAPHAYGGHYAVGNPGGSVYHKGWDRVYERPFHVDDMIPNH